MVTTLNPPGVKAGSQVGRSVPRLEGRDKVTGRAEYTHTMRVPGMVHAKIFRSTVAHGRIKSVDTTAAKDHTMNVYWGRRTIVNRIVALGLTGSYVPLEVRAYTNRVGRQLMGFGYVKFSNGNNAGSLVAMQQNYPNPFNPTTKINFSVSKAGNVDVRVFNTRGELVRTITNQWYPQGEHTVSWDGSTKSGGHAASGIYYIRAKSGGSTDVIKTVLAK